VTPAVAQLSAALATELEANSAPPDPRTVPLRFSHLKQMQRSPAHARHAMRYDGDPTLAKRIGSAAHSLLLGGPALIVFPGKVRNGKTWDAFKAEHADKIICSQKERDRAQRVNDAVRSNPVASRVLYGEGYTYEQTINWTWQGRAVRCTPDVRSWRHLVDLKTCRTAEPEKFMWDCVRMGYHAQLALYSMAMATQNKSGSEPQDVYIVAVESFAPHDVVVRHLTPQARDVGRRLVERWMERFLECECRGEWPGYATAPVDLDVPLEAVDLVFDDDESDNDNAKES